MPRSAPRNGAARQSSIVKRADGRYQVKVSYLDDEGATQRLALTGRSRDEVQAKADEARKRLNTGMPVRDTALTVARMATDWVAASLAASDRKATTKALYAAMVRNHIVGSSVGHKALRDLKPSHVEAWTVELKRKGLAQSTVRQAYTVLRAVLDTAVRDGDLAVNPAAKVKRPKIDAREAAHLSPDAVARVLAAADGSRYAPLFELLANTGMRRGEALALKWADIDEDAALIRIRGTLARVGGDLVVQAPKTKKSRRSLHLGESNARVLRSLRSRQAADRLRAGNQWHSTGYVFTTELGEPCDPRNALRAFSVAAKRAGVDGVGLHTLRHSAAAVMLMKGVPLKVVSEILGHSSIQVTGDIYGHVSPEVSADAMAVLDAALHASRTA
jgi:integrase